MKTLLTLSLISLLFQGRREVEITAELAPKYKAEMQVTLTDGTYCDLVTETHEAVGQSLHYSIMTGKKPGIILLTVDPSKEWIYLVRCARVCGKHDITLYVEIVK